MDVVKADIIVVGCGFSGLAAARALRESGAQVVVLEARARAGGRAYTLEVPGARLEMGAQWIGPGQPEIKRLAAEFGEAVWESTHLGGHRFAPTGVLLPTGYAYADLTVERGRELLGGGRVVSAGCRGRSAWSPPGQVAELAVRELTHTLDPDVLRVRSVEADDEGGWRVVVWHVDGRGWVVAGGVRELGSRPASCGAGPTPVRVPVVLRID